MKGISGFKNILVYRIGHLGDTIIALPAFREIKKRFPEAKITLLTNCDGKNKNYVTAKNILPEKGLFDSYITYDNSAVNIARIGVFTKLFFDLKKRKFDCLYYLSTRNRTDRQIDRDLNFFRFAGIKEIFGAEYARKNQLNFDEGKPLPEVEPEYKFLFESIDEKKSENFVKFDHDLKLNNSETEFAEDWLKKNSGDYFLNNRIVAVAPGSKWKSKIWFEENYLELLKKLIAKHDLFPIIFGGREDYETGERILSKLKFGANSAGYFSIRESSAALKKCRFYLGNDTGTMHLAAAVGTPCVAIFAATDYRGRWYPFGEDNKIFRKTVGCEGCHTPECFNEHECLKLVKVEEVYQACRDILEK